MNYDKESLRIHEKYSGKISIESKAPLNDKNDLSVLYTPGVAAPCMEINKDQSNAKKYTSAARTVAVVSDGTSVLGLGDIGPKASLPVMEGKAVLFKKFANIGAFPIVLDTKDTQEIINTIVRIAPSFGGINLEDISAPRCFEIEEKLDKLLDIPVFHDDQHGTAIVVLAGLINSLKIVNKNKDVKVVINGAGSAGIAITKLIHAYGIQNITVCDSKGIISESRYGLNDKKKEILEFTNLDNKDGSLYDALIDSDVFIGVSKGNLLEEEHIKSMKKDSIIMAMANPTPEIDPQKAKNAGAKIVATGRSDYPNQLNNVLVFPGIFKGAFESNSKSITVDMKIAAAKGLALLVEDLNEEKIIPSPFDEGVSEAIAKAVKKC